MDNVTHLGNSTPIATVQDKEILLTSDTGQTFKMKLSDLAEAIRLTIPTATSEKNGLMSSEFCLKSYTVTKDNSFILSEGVYIIKASFYNRAAILMVSNSKSIFLAKDDFFEAYVKIEVYKSLFCKITNTYVQGITYFVTKIA